MDRNTLSHYGWIVIVIIILSCMIIMSTPLGKFWARGFEATWAGFGQTSNNAMDVIKPNPNPNPDTPDPTPTPDEPDPTPDPDTPPEDGEIYMDNDYIYTYYTETDYTYDGWHVQCINNTKTEYSPILTEIKGKPIVDMRETFTGCRDMIKSPTIPSTVKTMTRTYNNCTSLKTYPVIPDTVEKMIYTFEGCTSLTSATMPQNVKCFNGTFKDCTSLKTIYPDGGSSAEQMNNTFENCTSLKDLNGFAIPETVIELNSTFKNCTSLTGRITINANPTIEAGLNQTSWFNDIFKGTTQSIYLTGNNKNNYLTNMAKTSSNGNIHVM